MFGQEYTSIEPMKKKQEIKASPVKPGEDSRGVQASPKPPQKVVPMNIQSAQEDAQRKMN